MLVIFRILFTGLFVYTLYTARNFAGHNTASGDLTNAFNMAVCVILAIAAAVSWAPFFGDKISEPITGMITSGTYSDRKYRLARLIRWCDDRRYRKWTLLLCFVQGIRYPWLPTAFVIGLKNARRGSWLEKLYAIEVFKFDNAQNCLEAFEVLQRHGIDPRPHHNPEINLVLLSKERSVRPELAAVPLPPAPPPPPVQREKRIKLFDREPQREEQNQ